MKKTQRWVLSCVLFLICFSFVFLRVSEILRNKHNAADMVHSFYDLEENTLDVLVLGSSHAYYGYSPSVLWDRYGVTSYIMGSPRQTLPISYLLLKEALKYQKPKVVLLETYGFRYDNYYDETGTLETSVRVAFDALKLCGSKLEMLKTFLPDSSLEEKLSFIIPFMEYHSRWEELKNADFVKGTSSYLKGSQFTLQTDSNLYDPGIDDAIKVTLKKLPMLYFEKIRALCEENDIQLALVAIPMLPEDDTKDHVTFYRRMAGLNLALEKFSTENGIPFLYGHREGVMDLDPKTDYCDWSHLNYYGQLKASAAISDFLADHFEFPDHREDPAYISWEEDSQKYQEMVTESIEEAEEKATEVTVTEIKE